MHKRRSYSNSSNVGSGSYVPPYHGFRNSTLAVFIVALVFFSATAAHFAFPGTSAKWMAEVAGFSRPALPDYPVWRLAMACVAKIPVFEIPLRLNLASALLGAVTAAAVFRFVSMIVNDFVPEALSIGFVRRTARVSGTVAAVVFALSASGWSISSHLHPAAMDIAAMAVCLNLAVDSSATEGCHLRHVVAAFLTGLFAPGSGGFTIIAPFILALLVLYLRWENGFVRRKWYARIALAFIAGLAAAVTLGCLLPRSGELPPDTSIFPAFISHWTTLVRREFLGQNAYLCLATGYIPFAIAVILARDSTRRRAREIDWFATALTFALGAIFIGFPGTPWNLAGRFGIILTPPLLLLTLASGVGAGFWYLCHSKTFLGWTEEGLDASAGERMPTSSKSRRDSSYDDDESPSSIGFPMYVGACCIAVGAVLHFFVLHLGNGAFLDSIAEHIVAHDSRDEWPLDDSIIAPHCMLAEERVPESARAEAASHGAGGFSLEVAADLDSVLGKPTRAADTVDEIRESLRGHVCKNVVNLGVDSVVAGDDAEADLAFRHVLEIDSGNVAALANRISLMRCGFVPRGLTASQAESILRRQAEALTAENGAKIDFDVAVDKFGQVFDPASAEKFGIVFLFDEGREESPGYDADFASAFEEAAFREFIGAPGHFILPEAGVYSGDTNVQPRVELAAREAFHAEQDFADSDFRTSREHFRRSGLAIENTVALLGQARCSLALGDAAAAEEFIRKLLLIDPEPGKVTWNVFAMALHRQEGRGAEALEAARKSVQCDGGLEKAGVYPRYALALCLAAAGEPEEAREVAKTLFKEISSLPGEMRSDVTALSRGFPAE